MPAKDIHSGEKAQQGLLAGVQKVAGVVKMTMGPRGKNVIIERQFLKPLVTKDGVTVAENVTLENGLEEMGASLVIDAAQRTASVAGDGTTCACVLSEAVFASGIKKLNNRVSSIKMKRGMDTAVSLTEQFLRKLSRKVEKAEELEWVATIAANGDKLMGKLIGDAMDRCGVDGCIIVQDGDEDRIECVDGTQIRSGMRSTQFHNVKYGVCEYRDCAVFVCNKSLSSGHEVAGLLGLMKSRDKPVAIFAKDFSPEVLHTLLVNRQKNHIACVAIKIPDFADHQEEIARDIAAVTGATAITKDNDYDLKKFGKQGSPQWDEFLGRADVLRSTMSETTIVLEKSSDAIKKAVDQRIEQAKTAKDQIDKNNTAGRDKLQRRIASLSGGVVKLIVSSQTDSEMGQKKARVEDALYAVQAAAREGIVPGGGAALFYAGCSLVALAKQIKDESERVGYEIVAEAIQEPLIQIARNVDPDMSAVVRWNLKDLYNKDGIKCWGGWDADNDKFGDMYEFKIIDPVLVPITALKNALSVADLLLNSGAVIEFLQPENAGDGKHGHVGRS